MNDCFYRAFEEKHRGSRALIKSRLRVYLPFVKPLLSLHEEAKAIDLGCGRGEWLEILDEAGFQPYGVDLNSEMLAVCHERGLNVERKDAIEALKALPDETQAVVSGFHIVEHLPFSELQVLVQEAFRVLKPAGLLIMETPNPENLIVGATNFYLDPTHNRPIPPQLLSFLPEYYGYGRIKIIRLQEPTHLATSDELQLMDVLGGVSPDYAVVAQKAAHPEMLAITAAAFDNDYGLNLENLATRYSRVIANHVSSAERAAQSAESRVQQLAAELQGVYTGRSWRITKPLRWLGRQARLLHRQGLVLRIEAFGGKITRQIIRRPILFISAHPILRFRCVTLAHKFGCYFPLRSLYWRLSNKFHLMDEQGKPNKPIMPYESTAQLTPRARRIYDELKDTIEKKEG